MINEEQFKKLIRLAWVSPRLKETLRRLLAILKQEEEDGMLRPLAVTRQHVWRNIAHAAAGQYPNRIWYDIDSIQKLMHDPNVTDKPLRDFYGDKFDSMMRKLRAADEIATRIKIPYDFLEAKQIIKWDWDSKEAEEFRKGIMRLRPVQEDITEMFYVLFNATVLREQSVPNEAFVVAISKHKVFVMDEQERKIVEKQQKENEEEEGL